MHQLQGVVGVDAAEASRASPADAELGIGDARQRLHPALFANDPGTADGGEETPAIVLTEFRRGIATGVHRQRVALVESILGTEEKRFHVRIDIVGIGAVPWACGTCGKILVAEIV